jgi:hypothetical protein
VELDRLQQRFESSLNRADRQLILYLSTVQRQNLKVDEIHQLEGWLSDLWQIWGRFCRTTVFASCTGCSTQTAGAIAAVQPGRGEVSYIAAKQRNGMAPIKAGSNSLLRAEPTWGHIDRLIEVILQTHKEVLAISAGYKATGITHPVEALLWIDPATGRTLVQARMDDMRVASKNVCA